MNENATEKQKRHKIYKMKHNSSSNLAIGVANTMFPTQGSSNQNSRFLNGKVPYSPGNQGKLNQASNSNKDANSP
jgi:hypothetical protein